MQRTHGYNHDSKSYIMGKSALVSIAIKAGVDIDSNTVVAPLDEFKRIYGIDPAGSQYIDATYGWYKDGSTQSFDYIISAAARTFTGVDATGAIGTTATIGNTAIPTAINSGTSAADVAYKKAYFAGENLRKIVDTVQQRAVVLGISPVGAISATAAISTTNGWSVNIAAGAGVYVVTLLVERAEVFDKAIANQYGQPTTPVVGQALVDDLAALSLYDSTGALVQLTTANTAVMIQKSIPQVY